MLNKKLYATIKSEIFFFLLLTAVVFCLYGKSINFDFTYHDDNSLILEKENFLSDITNSPKLFITSCYYSGDFQYYRPILNLSFLLETSMFGLNSKVYHITNILLFIFVLYLMYVLFSKLKFNKKISRCLILLLAVHPIFTSTVVWIPARNDTLLAIFMFFSFMYFIDYLEHNKIKNLILYVLFFTIALFTKETALLMLFLYPLFIICFDYKLTRKEITKNILIFIFISIIYFYLRSISVQNVNINFYLDNVFTCFNNFIVGISTYIYNFFVPVYIPVMLYDSNLTINSIVLDSLLLIVVIFLCYKKIINIKILLFSVVWLLIGLITTFLLQEYVYLNHRLIVSLFGIALILVHLIDKLILKYKQITTYLLVLSIILFLYYFCYSFNLQNKYENEYEYWNNAYLDAPNYHGCYYSIARFFFESNDFDKAREILKKVRPDKYHLYYSDLALMYYYEGDLNKAEELYNKSIEYGINKAQCYRNLSVIYLKRDNDINKAIEYAKIAVKEEPYDDGYKIYLQKLIETYKDLVNETNNI